MTVLTIRSMDDALSSSRSMGPRHALSKVLPPYCNNALLQRAVAKESAIVVSRNDALETDMNQVLFAAMSVTGSRMGMPLFT